MLPARRRIEDAVPDRDAVVLEEIEQRHDVGVIEARRELFGDVSIRMRPSLSCSPSLSSVTPW